MNSIITKLISTISLQLSAALLSQHGQNHKPESSRTICQSSPTVLCPSHQSMQISGPSVRSLLVLGHDKVPRQDATSFLKPLYLVESGRIEYQLSNPSLPLPRESRLVTNPRELRQRRTVSRRVLSRYDEEKDSEHANSRAK